MIKTILVVCEVFIDGAILCTQQPMPDLQTCLGAADATLAVRSRARSAQWLRGRGVVLTAPGCIDVPEMDA